ALVALVATLVGAFILLHLFGHVIAPVLVAVAVAYVLDGVVEALVRLHLPRWFAVAMAILLAAIVALIVLLLVLPLLLDQVSQLVERAPLYLDALREAFQRAQKEHGEWVNPALVQQMAGSLLQTLQSLGGKVVSFSLASIPTLVALAIYLVLVPVLVFFLLKDKRKLIAWARRFLPADHKLFVRVWREVDVQIGNYIRGKFWETIIVGCAAWIVFAWLDHPYALMLGVLTGISVWVPFVGAAVVTLPVVLLSVASWGLAMPTLYAIAAYLVVQMLDGNVLVPWLFSEMVDLHPVAIVVAVLVFGALWGLVGVFVAIPMAALIESVLTIIWERIEALRAEAPPETP
ncbi:MAG: AI-2E family transporter, partial [Zetaproteobacteria bacterium]